MKYVAVNKLVASPHNVISSLTEKETKLSVNHQEIIYHFYWSEGFAVQPAAVQINTELEDKKIGAVMAEAERHFQICSRCLMIEDDGLLKKQQQI